MDRSNQRRGAPAGDSPNVPMVTGSYVLAGAFSLALALRGLGMWGPPEPVLLGSGFVGLLLVLTVGPVALVLALRREPSPPRDERLDELIAAVRDMHSHAALSDDARRVLNRAHERQLLRRAIQEDIEAEDWDAASVLVDELADRFGYRADAEEFRQRINEARASADDRRVAQLTARIDQAISAHRWHDAMDMAAGAARLYPQSAVARSLRHRVERARDFYKADLERRFLLSASENRIDEAMDLLRQLDQYLAPDEAEQYREVARGVVTRAKDNLGVQFKLAVQDRQWDTACIVGERLIAEFPNTRMAHEVRGLLDNLRERATRARAAVEPVPVAHNNS